jgi:GDP-L-fucose synthase
MPVSKNARIYIADHEGFFGGAIVKKLQNDGFRNLILAPRKSLDLMDQKKVEAFFKKTKPSHIYLAAQFSGGILANIKYPGDFIYKNLMIQTNVIHAALGVKAKKLLFFGASCIYPKETPQPIKESFLFEGPFEKTSEAYSIAKLAGVGMCQAYNAQYEMSCIPVIPATVYGPGANFDPVESHVLAALIRKFHEAKVAQEKKVIVFGSGKPRREFLYIDDLAAACTFLMDHYDNPDLINVGSGEDIAIRDLAKMVKKVVGFSGELAFDSSKPDGVMRKMLDSEKINKLGWHPTVDLEEGIRRTYEYYATHIA